MTSFHLRTALLLLFATPLALHLTATCVAAQPITRMPLAAGFNRSISGIIEFSNGKIIGSGTPSNGMFFPFTVEGSWPFPTILATQGFSNGSKGFSWGILAVPNDQIVSYDFYLSVCIGQLNANLVSGYASTHMSGRHDTASIEVVTAGNSISVPVWSANAGRPLTSVNAWLAVGKAKALELRDADGSLVWSVGPDVAAMELQDSGNLVILDSANRTLWQSFQNPTDTLVLSQNFTVGMSLTSNDSRYSLAMEARGLVFYLIGLAGAANSSFWIIPSPNNSTDTSVHRLSHAEFASAVLTAFTFDLYSGQTTADQVMGCELSADVGQFSWADLVRLENDGRLHFYAVETTDWQFAGTLDSLSCWTYGPSYVRMANRQESWGACDVPMACGPLGMCSPSSVSNPSLADRYCTCPPGGNGDSFSDAFTLMDEHDASKGCKASVLLPNCSSLAPRPDRLLQVNDTATIFQFSGQIVNNTTPTITLESCKHTCLSSRNCTGIIFNQNKLLCFPINMDHPPSLLNVTGRSDNLSYVAFLKIVPVETVNSHSHRRAILVASICAVSVAFIALVLYGCHKFILRGGSIQFSHNNLGEDVELSLLLPTLPTRFSFKELHKATQGFNRLLGAGGMGSVYAGALPDGKEIAVKKLDIILRGDMSKGFLAEVATMGRTSHFNILQLLGFCWETSHQMLVYEYMERGSLDRWLFEADQFLDWATRFKVAVGIARGVAYLHEGCTQPILHLDIKPQNILLDEDFEPKLSDFGLAKLMARDASHMVTAVRGTPGYIAPEMFWSVAPVSKKCDMYSLGMVLLEMVGGRKNIDLALLMAISTSSEGQDQGNLQPVVEQEEQWHFPSWAAKKCEEGRKLELVDRRLQGNFCAEEASRMIEVALWCIQEKPSTRPSAETVVQWLEGSSVPLEDAPFSTVAYTQSRVKSNICQYLQASHTTSTSNKEPKE